MADYRGAFVLGDARNKERGSAPENVYLEMSATRDGKQITVLLRSNSGGLMHGVFTRDQLFQAMETVLGTEASTGIILGYAVVATDYLPDRPDKPFQRVALGVLDSRQWAEQYAKLSANEAALYNRQTTYLPASIYAIDPDN